MRASLSPQPCRPSGVVLSGVRVLELAWQGGILPKFGYGWGMGSTPERGSSALEEGSLYSSLFSYYHLF